jgi:hypothetical protein
MNSHRRQFLVLTTSAGVLASLPSVLEAAKPVASKTAKPGALKLASTRTVNSLQRFTAVVEVEGTLRMNPDGKKLTTAPIKVLANLEFDERTLAAGKSTRVVRYYNEAGATIKIDRTGMKSALRENAKTLCVELGEESPTIYSPLGPITRDELELVKLPGDPIVWNGLLPAAAVKPGETWKLTEVVLANLLGIDVVTANDVTAKLTEVDAKLALIELEGSITGAIGGVATEVDLKAKANFDLAKKQLTWLALGIKEKRAIGHAAPGYEITSRVRIAAAPISSSPNLTDAFLRQFPLELKDGSTLLTHDSTDGAFQLLHDRRWHVMTDHSASSILRLVDGGDLIAQCNISRLRDMPADKQLTLEAFQKEVTATLGVTLQEILDADQGTTDNGLRQLRIVAAGTVQEVPVQWFYYHLADDQGRNAAMVFTMDARLVERFAELDRSIVGSLTLRSRPADATSTEPASEENPQEAPQEQAAKPTTTKKK